MDKPRILLAEDSLIGRKMAARLLEHCGYSIDTAENGREAVEKATTMQYDLILMDMFMPVMDGAEAAAGIRNAGISTPIVALSANSLSEDEKKRFHLDDAILKPLTESEILRVVGLHCVTGGATVVSSSSQPAATAEDVFDEKAALEFAGGSRSLLDEMLQLYAGAMPGNIGRIAAGIGSADPAAIRSAAHLIKGESKALGIRKVFASASAIEEAAKAGDIAKSADGLKELESNFEEFKAARLR